MQKFNSYAELVQTTQNQQQQMTRQQQILKALEPYLKQRLAQAMINREEIRVVKPIQILTERLNKGTSERLGGFTTSTSVIPAGEVLQFERRSSMLNMWIFKSLTRDEVDYEIYETPVVAVNAAEAAPNPGFWGLLQNTSIFQEVYEHFRDQIEGK